MKIPSGDTIRTVGAIAGILTVIGTVIWFAASLSSRVGRLEEQVHTLTVAPAIANAATGTTAPNPIAQACADLARTAVSAAGSETIEQSVDGKMEAETMLKQLGCTHGN